MRPDAAVTTVRTSVATMSHDVTTSNGKLQSSSTMIPASASTSPLTHKQGREPPTTPAAPPTIRI